MKIKEIVRKIQYISIKELNEMAMNPSLRDNTAICRSILSTNSYELLYITWKTIRY